MGNEKSATPKPTDGCPDWANTLIGELRRMEVALGNIPETDQWKSADLDALQKRAEESVDPEGISEEMTEILFRKICIGLAHEGFEADEIAAWVNSRVFYKGGPKYCDIREVNEALAQKRA